MIRDYALNPTSGIAQHYLALPFVNVVAQTNAKLLAQQIASGLFGLAASVYAEGAVTANIAADVGHVPVGSLETAVNLGIGGTVTKFKLNAALLGLSAAIDPLTGLPTRIQKAITDNLVFSAAQKINAAATAGQFWGAWRIFMNADGTIGTRASSADQRFAVEADAIRNVPPAAAPEIDLGTISIRSAAGATFTTTVTALNAGGTTVNYNGRAAGFVSWLTAPIVPIQGQIVNGVLAVDAVRRADAGALLMARYTSDGAGAVVGAVLQLRWRVYPLNGEFL